MRARKFTILLGIGGIVAAMLVAYANAPDCRSVYGDAVVAVDASSIRPGHAQRFCYTDKTGKKLRFILARDDDGRVSSVFDACSQCYIYHRGYKLAAGEAICRVCGNRYPIGHITQGKASCVPVNLPHEDKAGVIRIKTADLESGRQFF
jgi:uncharacterized membrane protein